MQPFLTKIFYSRRITRKIAKPVAFSENRSDDDVADLFISVDSQAANRLRKAHCEKWDSKKLKLADVKSVMSRFFVQSYAPGLVREETVSVDEDEDEDDSGTRGILNDSADHESNVNLVGIELSLQTVADNIDVPAEYIFEDIDMNADLMSTVRILASNNEHIKQCNLTLF